MWADMRAASASQSIPPRATWPPGWRCWPGAPLTESWALRARATHDCGGATRAVLPCRAGASEPPTRPRTPFWCPVICEECTSARTGAVHVHVACSLGVGISCDEASLQSTRTNHPASTGDGRSERTSARARRPGAGALVHAHDVCRHTHMYMHRRRTHTHAHTISCSHALTAPHTHKHPYSVRSHTQAVRELWAPGPAHATRSPAPVHY